MAKKLIFREKAELDVRLAVSYYRQKSVQLAYSLIDEFSKVYGYIRENPRLGANRYAYELNIPGLKNWLLTGFPYIIFYIEQAEYIYILRVLHSHQQIPQWMSQS